MDNNRRSRCHARPQLLATAIPVSRNYLLLGISFRPMNHYICSQWPLPLRAAPSRYTRRIGRHDGGKNPVKMEWFPRSTRAGRLNVKRSAAEMNVVALVLAGGNGTRLHPLTVDHAKPALPLAVGYRIIDFVLSTLVNSQITSIHVLAQYKPRSLIEHIRTAWAPWSRGPDARIAVAVSYTHLRAHETRHDLVCR